jgi:predicted DNA-binding antitoxin AbrB/MazE fold protein
MAQTIQAVYENGVLRPTTLLFDIKEGQKVLLVLEQLPEADPQETERRQAELLRRLEAAGALARFPAPAESPPAYWQPLTIKGEPLSETIIRMRGEK